MQPLDNSRMAQVHAVEIADGHGAAAQVVGQIEQVADRSIASGIQLMSDSQVSRGGWRATAARREHVISRSAGEWQCSLRGAMLHRPRRPRCDGLMLSYSVS